ncbi:hypothetical protein F5884DRAFT_49652 [Xylogone sp. PMI_703]|nr:hypothetical protein F5884DRAFT_49652 [Xylogone sp. PMI_703]
MEPIDSLVPSPKEETQSPAATEDSSSSLRAARRRQHLSGRTISSLTPEQQQKKRINDREAQRASRARAKAELEALRREIAELKSQKPYLELQRAISEKELVEAENRSIKRRLADVMGTLRSILGDHGIDYAPDALSSKEQLSASRNTNRHTSVSTPTSLPSPANYPDNQWQPSSSKNTPDRDRHAYLHRQEVVARGLDAAAERMGLNFLLDDTQGTKKIAGEMLDSQNFQVTRPGTGNKVVPTINQDTLNLPFEVKAYSAPVKNSAPTCTLDSILLNFIYERKKQAAEGEPSSSVIGPAYPSVASLLNPALSVNSHRLSRILTDIIATFPDFSTIPERVAVLYVMFLFMRWRISPTQENYDRLPEWLTPRSYQLFTTHPLWIDFIPWPKMRDGLVRDYITDHYIFDDFFVPFTTTLSLNWPYAAMDTLISSPGSGEEFMINPVFERHIRDLRNWTLGPVFTESFPKLADTCRIKPEYYRRQ